MIRPAEFNRFQEAVIEGGLMNLGHAIEARAKANAPVRGGHRSFAPGGPIGGTLRRSIHTAREGSSVVVGTNVEYASFVHDGTVKMRARPFLLEALQETQGEAAALIVAGTQRRLG